MKKKVNCNYLVWSELLFIMVCCFAITFISVLACDNDDDDDSTDDNVSADDDETGDDDDSGFCTAPEWEECIDDCYQERTECASNECGESPIDVDDPCGLDNNSDDDDDGDDDDWSDDPELKKYCECIVACYDEAKECFAECDELYPC